MWVFLHFVLFISKIIDLNVKHFFWHVHQEYFSFLRLKEIWICILYMWEVILLVWPLVIALAAGVWLWKCYPIADDCVIKTPGRTSMTFQSLPVCKSSLIHPPTCRAGCALGCSHAAELCASGWEVRCSLSSPWPALKLQLLPLFLPELGGRYPWASRLFIPDPGHHSSLVPAHSCVPASPSSAVTLLRAQVLLCPSCSGAMGADPMLVRSLSCWPCCHTWLLASFLCREASWQARWPPVRIFIPPIFF